MKQANVFRKFFTLLEVDFYKLFRSVSFYVLFGGYALFTILNVFLNYAANIMLEVSYNGDAMILGMVSITANSLFGSNINYSNFGLFLVIFFAIFLCTEFKDNTIRNKLTQGYSRTVVYIASLTFTYIVSLMAVVLSSALIAAVGIPVLGWEGSDFALKYFFYELFALLPLVALIHTLAYGSKSLGITLGVGLPVITVLPGIVSILNIFAINNKAVEWVTRIFFISLEGYVPLALDPVWSAGSALSNLALNVSLTYVLWTALFIALGYLAFVKKDVK